MNDLQGVERCATFINCQISPAKQSAAPWHLALTLSRQCGAGAHDVAEQLAQCLQSHTGKGLRPWTVFDKNLVAKVLDDHHLSAQLDRFLTEDAGSVIEDTIQEVLGLHPPTDELVRQVTETILRLAHLGNVIIIGRGANVITSAIPHVFHVRLVGSVDRRIERIAEILKLSRKAAASHIEKEDRARARYLKRHYGADVDDPLLYHLVVNTDRLDGSAAAELIAEAALSFAR
jgi:cytidylate kinase